MSTPAIALTRVTKRYGSVLALNDVTLEIESGITGLIGPNAAGKTTFLNLAVGLHFPSSGKVRLFGENPFSHAGMRKRLGYCPDGERVWDWMTGKEFVLTLAGFGGMDSGTAEVRADEILRELEMSDAADKPIRQYSRGMRQKVKVAQAVLHEPALLVLDEPLNGVDPLSRHQILKMLEERARNGTSVLVSSHVLHELDGFVDQVILLQRGRLLASGTVDSIRELLDEHPHTVRFASDDPRTLAQELIHLPGVVNVGLIEAGDEHSGPAAADGLSVVDIRTRSPAEFYASLPALITRTGLRVEQMYSPDSNLEAVFKYLVKGGGAG